LARETEIDPDLARVVSAWPDLPEAIRRAVLALIGSTNGLAAIGGAASEDSTPKKRRCTTSRECAVGRWLLHPC
jgi:hypothetical protein